MVNNPAPPVPAAWCPGRTEAEYAPRDNRLTDSPASRGVPWSINKALTELCGIPGQAFFVAAVNDGQIECYSTPFPFGQLSHDVFFDDEAFGSEVTRVKQEPGTAPATANNRVARRSNVGKDEAPRSNKRQRAEGKGTKNASFKMDKTHMNSVRSLKSIKIGDHEAVFAFYYHCLWLSQQNVCKIIAKAWIKAVHPRKQSDNPYTRGDESRPAWWPMEYKLLGQDEKYYLQHKEPDHINREERVFLLCHIVRMLVEPAGKRHPAIENIDLDLNALEKLTAESLKTFYCDKTAPANADKERYLREMFKVAKAEARYKDGELDAETEIFVTIDSDEETREVADETVLKKTGRKTRSVRFNTTSAGSDSDDEGDIEYTPPSSEEPTGPQMFPHAQDEYNDTNNFASNTFHDHVHMHASYHSQHSYNPEMSGRATYGGSPALATSAPAYGNNTLGVHEMYTSPQDSSRRSSTFDSPSEYGGPATPVIYPSWSSSSVPGSGPMYGFQPQQHGVHPFDPQMTPGTPYTLSPIDGLPRPVAEAHHRDMFAPRGVVGKDAPRHQLGYPNYVPGAASMGVPLVKNEREQDP
ncbi:hypothetical protein F4808DRAFT_204274 [Astrocystis sublimbata]|nr:hypothetical protein F4808DRAFT_204274 [Astrocystis sublimbata]